MRSKARKHYMHLKEQGYRKCSGCGKLLAPLDKSKLRFNPNIADVETISVQDKSTSPKKQDFFFCGNCADQVYSPD